MTRYRNRRFRAVLARCGLVSQNLETQSVIENTQNGDETAMNRLPELSIGDLTAQLPIVQGGMGVGISGPSLAVAVAGAGGIGVLSSAGMGIDAPGYKDEPVAVSVNTLKAEIYEIRQKTNGIVGVNIMVATSNFADMVQAAIDAEIDLIFAGAGLPLDLPKYLREGSKTKLVPIVSSGRAAALILRKWTSTYDYIPDAFVVEGPLAGGHLGFKKEQIHDPGYSLQKLVPQVTQACRPFEEASGKKIPVIAAGGVYSGRDIHEFMELGASGVQMGTRFVTTEECDASAQFKDSYLRCREEDIIIIDSPVGMPGRAIRNSFLATAQEGTQHPTGCPFQCIRTCDVTKSPYCIAIALLNAKKGKMDRGFAFAGQNAYRADRIISVSELMEEIKREYMENAYKHMDYPVAVSVSQLNVSIENER